MQRAGRYASTGFLRFGRLCENKNEISYHHMERIPSMDAVKNPIYPEIALCRQKLFDSPILNVKLKLEKTFSEVSTEKLKAGKSVAIGVGSRGISDIDKILVQLVTFLKRHGMKPFIFPAMGSHGGATAEGQSKVLQSLGIQADIVGAPIDASMDVVRLGKLDNGVDIFFSQAALAADYIVVVNRIKPHTKFRADIESGLCKMLTIGCGKHQGASEYHRSAVQNSFRIIEQAAGYILQQCNLLFGIGLVEDGYKKLSEIHLLYPDSIIEQEKQLLKSASAKMARIPFDDLDLLIVDYIGKNISGIGMDSNVTGRHRDIVGDFYESPHVRRIFVRDLTPETDGNGNGIGLADFVTTRLVKSLNLEKTYINAITAISPEKAAIPMHFDTDRKCLDACIKTLGKKDTTALRMVRIKNTAELEWMYLSRALADEANDHPDIEIMSPWNAIDFDPNDNLKMFHVKQ